MKFLRRRKPSNGLCSIDIDDDDKIEPFLEMNPQLKNSLRSRGARGGNIWVRVRGEYPKLTKLFQVGNNGNDTSPKQWGEWRSTGGQTVIFGRHPLGCDYQIVQPAKPVEVEFKSIVWPDDLHLPWDLALYDELVNQEGQPFGRTKSGAITINEWFFVSKFALEHVVLHEPDERGFYYYDDHIANRRRAWGLGLLPF